MIITVQPLYSDARKNTAKEAAVVVLCAVGVGGRIFSLCFPERK